jgi:DNA-binding transcriptional ArsR family regulator
MGGPTRGHVTPNRGHVTPNGVDTKGEISYNGIMLELILGSRTAFKIFLHLHHHGETYARGAANDMGMTVGQVQRQLDRFENAGLLVSRTMGRTRIYQFNGKSPMATPFKELVRLEYGSLPLEERERLFQTRRRPRRKGKPVIGRSGK